MHSGVKDYISITKVEQQELDQFGQKENYDFHDELNIAVSSAQTPTEKNVYTQ